MARRVALTPARGCGRRGPLRRRHARRSRAHRAARSACPPGQRPAAPAVATRHGARHGFASCRARRRRPAWRRILRPATASAWRRPLPTGGEQAAARGRQPLAARRAPRTPRGHRGDGAWRQAANKLPPLARNSSAPRGGEQRAARRPNGARFPPARCDLELQRAAAASGDRDAAAVANCSRPLGPARGVVGAAAAAPSDGPCHRSHPLLWRPGRLPPPLAPPPLPSPLWSPSPRGPLRSGRRGGPCVASTPA